MFSKCFHSVFFNEHWFKGVLCNDELIDKGLSVLVFFVLVFCSLCIDVGPVCRRRLVLFGFSLMPTEQFGYGPKASFHK